ncbi:IclR family transcriptional regulator [Hutsoniella sourekii]
MSNSTYIQTLINADEILNLINKKREIGVSEISKNLSLPKTTCYRILRTLEHIGIVIQTANENYAIGYKVLSYQAGCKKDTNLIHYAKPFIDELADCIGETVSLVVEKREKCIYIYSKLGEFYALQSDMSPETELHISSTGKLFISQWPERKIEEYFKEPFRKRTINSITTFQEYKLEKQFIRENGYSLDREEYEYGLTCIASPIFINNKIIAAISISGPTTRLKHKDFSKLIQIVKSTSKDISEAIPLDLVDESVFIKNSLA